MSAELKHDRLFFYSKSKNSKPGEVEMEIVQDPTIYAQLSQLQHWRRVLSNFHVAPFKYSDGYTYRTIEHVFQAKKIALADPNKARLFTVESKNPIGAGNGLMAQQNRQLVQLEEHHLKQWDAIKSDVMAEAAACKYRASRFARRVLLATGDAQLWHYIAHAHGNHGHIRFLHLEQLRDQLRAEAAERQQKALAQRLQTAGQQPQGVKRDLQHR